MMQLPLVVVLLLLASVGTASAECAWVLWQKRIDYRAGKPQQGQLGWTVHMSGESVFATRKACEQDRELELEASLQVHNENKAYQAFRSRFGVTVQSKESNKTLLAVGWDCLPDTIDPRAAKWAP